MRSLGSRITAAAVAGAVSSLVSIAFAQQGGNAAIVPVGGLTWAAGSIPGVSTSAVDGDMAKGPSHFFLKYAAGLNTPLHHHTADHYVATISGVLVLTVDGKEHRLAPGSFFALTGKKAHMARCEGSADCIMLLDARGPWDVVPEERPAAKR